MKIGDFQLVADSGEMVHATIREYGWFRDFVRPIYRERWSRYWKFADTGGFLPEFLTGAFNAQADLQRLRATACDDRSSDTCQDKGNL